MNATKHDRGTKRTGPFERSRRAGWLLAASLGLGSLAHAGPARAADKSLCVFDPGGANGDLYAKMKGYATTAVGWGVNFTLKPYTDESVAASDFRNKKCDAVLLTGVTGKEFNKKTYTLEAMGLFVSYEKLRTAIQVLAQDKASAQALNRSGAFETVGVYPAGAVYLYVRDRQLSSVEKLSGRSIATLGGDPAARYLVEHVGATAKLAEVSTFASLFNNGSVDVCYSPATAYRPLELHRGIGSSGGVIRFPLAQLTFQLFIRAEEYPAGFAQRSREYASGQFGAMLRIIQEAEGAVKSWIDISGPDVDKYKELLRKVRDALVDQGVYDRTIVEIGERLRG
jgi:ABC-type amino acid transport substrate-binding protein